VKQQQALRGSSGGREVADAGTRGGREVCPCRIRHTPYDSGGDVGVLGTGLHIEDYRGQDRIVVGVARARIDESGGAIGVGAVALVDVAENVVCWLYSFLSVRVKKELYRAG
jgi:hypothetical protein